MPWKKSSKVKENPQSERQMPKLVKLGLVFLSALIAVVLLGGAGVALAYKGRFYPGTTIGGISVAGKSKAAGEALIANQVTQYENHAVVVTVPNINEPRDASTGEYPDLEIATTAKDLGIVFEQSQALDAAWQVGHSRNLLQWVRSTVQSIIASSAEPLTYTVDQSQIKAFINTNIVPKVISPTPAMVKITGTDVTIADAKPGLTVDQDQLASDLLTGLASATDHDPTYLRAPVKVVDATVTRASVQPVADQLNALGNLNVTLSVQDITLKPKRDQLLSWFTPVQDDKGVVTLNVNEDAIDSYLQKNGKNELSEQASVSAVSKALASLAKPDVKSDDLKKPVSVGLVIKPTLDTTPGNVVLGLFPGKYIQVNLSEQKLYLVNGTTLEKTYRVSTGAWSTPTPKGTFKIVSKSPRAYSKEFGLYMPWWQNFIAADPNSGPQIATGDYGIHELPEWPNGYKEGENHIGTPVSHGCIRLGVGPAKEVYDWTDIGTPLVIQ